MLNQRIPQSFTLSRDSQNTQKKRGKTKKAPSLWEDAFFVTATGFKPVTG